jgi:hypothetical protein
VPVNKENLGRWIAKPTTSNIDLRCDTRATIRHDPTLRARISPLRPVRPDDGRYQGNMLFIFDIGRAMFLLMIVISWRNWSLLMVIARID